MKAFSTVLIALIISLSIPAQTAKLFLIAGQSNAAGQGEASQSVVCSKGTAFEYNVLTNAIQHLQDPIGQNANNLQAATRFICSRIKSKRTIGIFKKIYC